MGVIGAGAAAGMPGKGILGGLGGGAAEPAEPGTPAAADGGAGSAALCAGAEDAAPAWGLRVKVCGALWAASAGGHGGQFGSRGGAAAGLGLGLERAFVDVWVVAGACPYSAGSRTAP